MKTKQNQLEFAPNYGRVIFEIWVTFQADQPTTLLAHKTLVEEVLAYLVLFYASHDLPTAVRQVRPDGTALTRIASTQIQHPNSTAANN